MNGMSDVYSLRPRYNAKTLVILLVLINSQNGEMDCIFDKIAK